MGGDADAAGVSAMRKPDPVLGIIALLVRAHVLKEQDAAMQTGFTVKQIREYYISREKK